MALARRTRSRVHVESGRAGPALLKKLLSRLREGLRVLRHARLIGSQAADATRVLALRHGQALGKVFDQEAATVLLAPTEDRAGFWVGAGNLVHHRGQYGVRTRAARLNVFL